MDKPLETWDPQPSERKYFRHHLTGDSGYLVVREGKDKIRLDRPMQEIIRTYNESEWVPDNEWRPFSRAQVTKLAFEADVLLRKMVGDFKPGNSDFLSLSQPDKAKWMKDGPCAGGLRDELYLAIIGVLGKVSR